MIPGKTGCSHGSFSFTSFIVSSGLMVTEGDGSPAEEYGCRYFANLNLIVGSDREREFFLTFPLMLQVFSRMDRLNPDREFWIDTQDDVRVKIPPVQMM